MRLIIRGSARRRIGQLRLREFSMGMTCKILQPKVWLGMKVVSRTVPMHPTRLSTCANQNAVRQDPTSAGLFLPNQKPILPGRSMRQVPTTINPVEMHLRRGLSGAKFSGRWFRDANDIEAASGVQRSGMNLLAVQDGRPSEFFAPEKLAQAEYSLDVFPCGLCDFHPAVIVVIPNHGDVLDPVALLLCQD
jgi:hypothetical protein